MVGERRLRFKKMIDRILCEMERFAVCFSKEEGVHKSVRSIMTNLAAERVRESVQRVLNLSFPLSLDHARASAVAISLRSSIKGKQS